MNFSAFITASSLVHSNKTSQLNNFKLKFEHFAHIGRKKPPERTQKFIQSGFSLSPLPSLSLLPSSPEPPGSSLCYRELFCPSAQRIRQQQSVFFWSQRPPPLPAGSTKTWSHRQPASSHHRPHEGKDVCVCLCVFMSSTKSI